ncbi:MAG: hypothetical protein LBS29_05710 [Endomicrobium sp.]|jgi:hypothetical protein|nr:hypothetical protein [Endomicrobium sp.]
MTVHGHCVITLSRRTSKKTRLYELDGYPQTEESLYAHIASLPEHSFFMAKNNDVRLSLAGTIKHP